MERGIEREPILAEIGEHLERIETRIEQVMFSAANDRSHVGHYCSLLIDGGEGHRVTKVITSIDLANADRAGWSDNQFTIGEERARIIANEYMETFATRSDASNGKKMVDSHAFITTMPEVSIIHRDPQ